MRRIAAFLNEYVETFDNRTLPASEEYIRSAIYLLISEDVFTKEELKYCCLKEQLVIIPDELIERS